MLFSQDGEQSFHLHGRRVAQMQEVDYRAALLRVRHEESSWITCTDVLEREHGHPCS